MNVGDRLGPEDEAPARCLVSVSHHADIAGGGEISLLTLLQGLDRRRWSARLVVPREGALARRARDLGVDVDFVTMPGLRLPRPGIVAGVLRLAGIVRRAGADIVHANGSRALLYAGLAGRLTRRPVVWHLRILDEDRPLDSLLVRLATGMIATSSAVRDRLRRWPPALDRCRIIPNGLDLDSFRPSREPEDVRRDLGITRSDLVVLTVGRMVRFKRQDLLLRAVDRLRADVPGLRGVLVGDGPERARLEQLAKELGIGEIVRFTGHRGDVPDLLAGADVFALPSPAEHFGRVVLEAMAAGVPVVAADAGGPGEILDHTTGVLVHPGSARALADGLRVLLEQPRRRRHLAAAARVVVEERYSMTAHARLVEDFFEELIVEGR